MDEWGVEYRDYNHNNDKCVYGKVCTHYTQMIWEWTTRVGCAVVQCSELLQFPLGGIYVLCQYYPQGNQYFASTDRPYNYTENKAGSGCAEGKYGNSKHVH